MDTIFRILDEKNQDKIGFNLDVLPKKIEDKEISEYIYKNQDGVWRYDRIAAPFGFTPYRLKRYWYFPFDSYSIKLSVAPTKFKGTWEESLFKIIR